MILNPDKNIEYGNGNVFQVADVPIYELDPETTKRINSVVYGGPDITPETPRSMRPLDSLSNRDFGELEYGLHPSAELLNIVDVSSHNSTTYIQEEMQHVYDDVEQCCMYVRESKETSDADTGLGSKPYISNRSRRSSHTHVRVCAALCCTSADQYGDRIQLELEHRVNAQERRRCTITLTMEQYESGKEIVSVLRKNGITCFNSKLSDSKMGSYLIELIRSKLKVQDAPPTLCGFGQWKREYVFVGEEFYRREKLPVVVHRHFDAEIKESFWEIGKKIRKIAQQHSDTKLFLILNTIRITAMLTTALATAGLRIPKAVLINGNACELSKYLQVYDREVHYQIPDAINVREKEFRQYQDGLWDEAWLLQDDANASDYKKRLGIDNIMAIEKMLVENQKQQEQPYPYEPPQ